MIAKRSALIAVLACLALAGASCATNPATGKKMFTLVGRDSEARMGREADPAIKAQYGVYGDAAVRTYVRELGLKLARRSEMPDLDWHFTVLDSPVVNAFALPGGYVYVTRGLLAHANSEAQLAGVIGHEIGHVTARHSARQMSQQQLLGGALAVASLASETGAAFADLANAGAGLFILRHSRAHERQSDELGVRYMTRAGYDPRELPGFFDVLDRLGERAGGGGLPIWLSTHPAPENRVANTEAMARQRVSNRGPRWKPTVGRDRYLDVIDGLVFGDDPRQGYFDGRDFFHPELRFTLRFPEGWVTLNRPTQVLAADDAEKATGLLRMTLGKAEGGESPGAYIRRKVEQADGVTLASGEDVTVNGLRGFLGRARASTSDGSELKLFVGAVEYGGNVYEFLGQATPSKYGAHEERFSAVVRSFDRLTDRARLDVQPTRIRLQRVDGGRSFGEVLDGIERDPDTRQELAILNQTRQRDRLGSGSTIKVVR